jgi:hypothetical protein
MACAAVQAWTMVVRQWPGAQQRPIAFVWWAGSHTNPSTSSSPMHLILVTHWLTTGSLMPEHHWYVRLLHADAHSLNKHCLCMLLSQADGGMETPTWPHCGDTTPQVRKAAAGAPARCRRQPACICALVRCCSRSQFTHKALQQSRLAAHAQQQGKQTYGSSSMLAAAEASL